MTTRSRKPSTVCTKPRSSAHLAPGELSSRSSWQLPSGSTGGTTGDCTAPSVTCHRLSLRRFIIPSATPLPPHDSKPPSLQKTQGDSVYERGAFDAGDQTWDVLA